MKGSLEPVSGVREEPLPDVLYESLTTRVVRCLQAGESVILKEAIGPGAARRREHEHFILARLAGIEGVGALAGGSQPDGMLILKDSGGVDLAQVMAWGRVGIDTALVLASRLAQVVAAVHRCGVIHRDINPANILVLPDGQPALIDFDLAMQFDELAGTAQQEGIVGTLAYLAPEQSGRTGRMVDQRADLYALGVTMYELVTGRLPFTARDALQLVHNHLVLEPAPPATLDAQVPAGLSDIILRLLAKAPEQRYQSAEGLLHDLQRLRAGLAQGIGGAFALGERDFKARLAPPANLVGREGELGILRDALSAALRTPDHTVLIEGAAGAGKSALMQQLRPMVMAAGGWFVSGKFDQYHQDVTTNGALTQALRAVGQLLLAQPKLDVAAHRERILARLGSNAGLLVRVSDEFALLLGTQPDVLVADPRQAELRLQQTMLDLLGAVASPERPLVIALDDLQWSPAYSLRMFERLMHDASLRGVLLVGAWRPGAVDANHDFESMLARWRQQPDSPTVMTLPTLTPAGMSGLVGQMLRLDTERAYELALAVGELTRGNPFDTVEMINALRRDGVLAMGEDGWQWDEASVRRFVGQGNVVDMLAARLARLTPPARGLLECMACLGTSVDTMLLATACGLSAEALHALLRIPLDDGLLMAGDGETEHSIRFRHDRVQQAVLRGLEEPRRERLQLAMARRLMASPGSQDAAARAYIRCMGALLEDQDGAEQLAVARLFAGVARLLARAATWLLAERFLASASTLLAAAAVPADAALVQAVDTERHAALYSLGRLDDADQLFRQMQQRGGDVIGQIGTICLQMRSLDMRGRLADSLHLGERTLGLLGLHIPPAYRAPDIPARLDALPEWCRSDGLIDPASRPCIEEPRLLGIARVLERMIRTALVLPDIDAAVWLLLESQRLWAAHGPCPALVACLGRMSGLLVGLRQDYRGAYEVARHVLTVGEELGYEPQVSEARATFVSFASHWFEPVEDTHRQSTRAYEGLLAGGDPSFAAFVHLVLFTNLLEFAPTADHTLAQLDAGIALCQRAGNVHAGALHMSLRQALRALRGLTQPFGSFDDAQFNSQEFLAHMGRLPFVENAYSVCRAMHAMIMGDGVVLGRLADKGLSHIANLAGYYMTVNTHFVAAMARAWELQPGGEAAAGERGPVLAALDASRDWLAARAADQPHNYLHLLCFVDAERAWALDDMWAAAAAFDAALEEVARRRRPWHQALITERAALFHMDHALSHTGHELMFKARDLYAAWGAMAKVAQLERVHPFLQRAPAHPSGPRVLAGPGGGSGGISPDALDLMGVLSASQALSSETSPARLAVRVTEVLSALSGATRVLVFSLSEDQWWLLAPTAAQAQMPVADAAACGLMPLSAFTYAQRTAQVLAVDDAPRDDRFARDPYFAQVPMCSLLLVPIAGQGAARAMLYLENRLGRAAFNAERLDAVKLIAGQLAVSLANAQLYESLEQRVHARTRELEQTQAQLVTTARRAGKAEIANNVLHNVGNVLNSINVSASMVRRSLGESRARGLAQAVGLMNEHAHDLSAFTHHDPRGAALLPYLNQLVTALEDERERALDDLDRLTRSVEHISYVVATQQSHAGPSSLLESGRLHDLLEEALRLSADAIAASGVTVVREFADVPHLAVDRARLMQILVNLIGNAAQAMAGMPGGSRKLTLTTSLTGVDGGERLRVTVKDEGEGVAQENLPRLFAHGFTTRKNGHGFGLHSSALAATEMGGKLFARSEGPGRGASFMLDIPVQRQDDLP
ncbi:MAG: ATPase [Comamonadaceae bacterium]|nr:MAG: ATPase [Comamonadaceae bacterium]